MLKIQVAEIALEKWCGRTEDAAYRRGGVFQIEIYIVSKVVQFMWRQETPSRPKRSSNVMIRQDASELF
jgi:hypothetical protein